MLTPSYSPYTSNCNPKHTPILPTPESASQLTTELPQKLPTNAEMNDRKSKGLCIYCGNPYTPENVRDLNYFI